MGRPLANGRPGTVVIPAGWAESLAPVVQATWMQNATVNLRKPGGTEAWSDDDDRTVTVPFDPFLTGVPANIQALTETSVPPADAVEDQVRVLGYLVTLPLGTAPTDLDEGVLVDIVTSDDPMLDGQTMHVTDIVRGGRGFERALICDLNT